MTSDYENPLDEIISYPKVEMSDPEIWEFVTKADAELEAEGVPIPARPIRLMGKFREHFGLGLTNRHPLYKRAARMLEGLYPQKDVSILPLHRGAFLYRESLYEMSFGQVFGYVPGINVDTMLRNMPEYRRQQLRSSGRDYHRFLNQACDLADFAQGVDDLSRTLAAGERPAEFLGLAKSHMQTAAIAAMESHDQEAALHSCFLGAELLFKGALAAKGFSDDKLKALRHDLNKLADQASQQFPTLSSRRLRAALGHLPKGVQDRYEIRAPSMPEVGHALMSGQYLGGALLRRLTDRDLRQSIKLDGKPIRLDRSYP